jgi:drug/metabolite transporter (DMT)-like permease
MIAVSFGVLTALIWALGTLSGARAARTIGPWSTTAWVMLVGLGTVLPLVAIEGLPASVDEGVFGWLAVAGVGIVVGMVFNYSALASGKVPVAAPIVSTEGAIAAALAVLSGEAVSAPLVALLALLAGGVFLAAFEPPGEASDIEPPVTDAVGSLGPQRAMVIPSVALAVAAAVAFGTSLFAAGHASADVPVTWIPSAGRIAGVILVAIPLALTRRLRLTRAALPFVAISGVAEVVGLITFATGARDSIAVTAVLASQSAVIAALVAHRLGERISRRQWIGVAVVAGTVSAVTIAQL